MTERCVASDTMADNVDGKSEDATTPVTKEERKPREGGRVINTTTSADPPLDGCKVSIAGVIRAPAAVVLSSRLTAAANPTRTSVCMDSNSARGTPRTPRYTGMGRTAEDDPVTLGDLDGVEVLVVEPDGVTDAVSGLLPDGESLPVDEGDRAGDRDGLAEAPKDQVPVLVPVLVPVAVSDLVDVAVRVLVPVAVVEDVCELAGVMEGEEDTGGVVEGEMVGLGVPDCDAVSEGLGEALRTESHTVHPTGAYCPGGQGVQLVAAMVSEKVSSGHNVQLAAANVLRDPGVHCTAVSLTEPGGHE